MGVILDGKKEALKIKNKLRKKIEVLNKKGIEVCLFVILVGENSASKLYVKNKQKACKEVGIKSNIIYLDESTTKAQLIDKIKVLNENKNVNGILVQLPIPIGIDEYEVICAIDPVKDVDCFHPINVAGVALEKYNFLPCTPSGILSLIESQNYDICGKNCVIVGRSNIVGKPMSFMMLKKNATVTICHSKTENLTQYTKKADILVVAAGRPGIIKKDMVKKGAFVVDVGINRLSNGKITGDVCFEEVNEVAGFITPVPGGVGPMTVAKLLENTVKAAILQNNVI